jgi:hypothetical protein
MGHPILFLAASVGFVLHSGQPSQQFLVGLVSQQFLVGLVWFGLHIVRLGSVCTQTNHEIFLDAPVGFGLPGLKMQFILKTQIKNELVNAFPFLGINNFVF